MKNFKQRTLALALSTLIAPMGAHATNGMFMIGYGAKSVGMGGTAIANPQDSLAGAVNPATIGWVDVNTMRADVGAELFLPSAYACLHERPICQESQADTFLIPNMAMAMKFNRKLTFGFSAVGAGGGGSRYNTNVYYYQDNPNSPDIRKTVGVNLMVMQMNPTVAYRVNKQNTVGASLIMSVQTFRAFGLERFNPFADPNSTLGLDPKGNDWSYGAGVRLGWMGSFMDNKLKLGASGSPRVYMSKFDKYSNVFAEQGDIDTPPVVGIGASYQFNDKVTVALDISHTFYSEINSISNEGPNRPNGVDGIPGPFPVDQDTNALGKDDGLGFGWDDQTAYKLGIAYQYDPKWTFRAGWNYGKSPIPEETEILFNLLAPASTQHHLTLGATYQLGPGLMGADTEVSFSYMHAFQYSQNGPTYIGSSGQLGMSQNAFGINFGLRM